MLENNFQSSESTKFMVNILGKHSAKIALYQSGTQLRKKNRYICMSKIVILLHKFPLFPGVQVVLDLVFIYPQIAMNLTFLFPLCICICCY